jgi:hypothetical protein
VLGLLKLIEHASLQTARETAVSCRLNPKPNLKPPKSQILNPDPLA